jgi:uncharacterized protein (DUF1800 family)
MDQHHPDPAPGGPWQLPRLDPSLEDPSLEASLPPPPRRFTRRQAFALAGGVAGVGAAGVTYALVSRSASAQSDHAQAAHLLRRAGFAPAQAELTAALSRGLPATLDQLLHPEAVSDAALESALSRQPFDFTSIVDLRRWWLTRMALTKRPLLEKTTLFWHGLLTSSYRKAGTGDLMYVQNQFLRANALGSLRDLLIGITRDGAMLRWLDGTGSNRADPNENYAREFMELFTMGVGNYTQDDVVAAARSLTGYAVDKSNQVIYRPAAHDNGTKTFLGHTGNLGVDDVVDIVLADPATPRYLAGRMWEFFAYPNPGTSDLAPVIDAFHATNGSIRAMLEAVFTSPGFSSAAAYRALVKSPTELIAGLARQLSLPVGAQEAAAGDPMGQALFDPPNVAGWPAGSAWLSTGSWMARMRYLLARSHQATAAPGVAAVTATATAGSGLGALIDLMVDGNVAGEARSAMAAHLAASPARIQAGEALFLVAATPEYQLA